MATSLRGGCMCGAVRYECAADPLFMGNCHCRDCQRAGGGAYAPGVGVPKAALKVTGEVKYHEITGGSGKPIARGFCPNCGSRLLVRFGVTPDIAVIQAASLDDPMLYKPMIDIFTASAQPWDQLSPQTVKFPQAPPQG
jgi:hypothetical protein